MNFLEARAKLKELTKGEYRRLSYSIIDYHGDNIEIECEAYAHNYSSHSAPTWDEALHGIACEMYPHGVFPQKLKVEVEDIVMEESGDEEK